MIGLLLLGCTGGSSGLPEPDDTAGSGAALFSAQSLTWTGLTPGFSQDQQLTVENVGTTDLEIEPAAIVTDPAGVFSTDYAGETLAPGGIATIAVEALLTEASPTTGELRVRTSDVGADSVIIALIVE